MLFFNILYQKHPFYIYCIFFLYCGQTITLSRPAEKHGLIAVSDETEKKLSCGGAKYVRFALGPQGKGFVRISYTCSYERIIGAWSG